jgi:hypothetical protein
MVSYYLPKKKINSDGQLFHQYKKKPSNHPSLQIIEHRKATTLEIQVVAWDTYTNVDGL